MVLMKQTQFQTMGFAIVVDTGMLPVTSVKCKKYECYDMDPAAESQEMKKVSAGAKRYNRCIKQQNQPEQLCEGKNATEQARLL